MNEIVPYRIKSADPIARRLILQAYPSLIGTEAVLEDGSVLKLNSEEETAFIVFETTFEGGLESLNSVFQFIQINGSEVKSYRSGAILHSGAALFSDYKGSPALRQKMQAGE